MGGPTPLPFQEESSWRRGRKRSRIYDQAITGPKPEFSIVQLRKVKLHDVRHGGEKIRERGLSDGHD